MILTCIFLPSLLIALILRGNAKLAGDQNRLDTPEGPCIRSCGHTKCWRVLRLISPSQTLEEMEVDNHYNSLIHSRLAEEQLLLKEIKQHKGNPFKLQHVQELKDKVSELNGRRQHSREFGA